MQIHGRECGLLLTVGASVKVADLCPDRDLKNIGDLMGEDKKYGELTDSVAKIIIAMSEGYEEDRYYSEQGYEKRPLTYGEIMSLRPEVLKELQAETFAAFKSGMKTEVEVESSKKKTETEEA